jgi:peptidoglycan/xylan/chitin deacetylase (PgdA/CDA1 family)
MKPSPFKRRNARAWSKLLWAALLRTTGLLALARTWVRRKGVLVLTFHRVLTQEELTQTSSLAGMIVRLATFDRFLAYASTKCDLVDLQQEPEWKPSRRLRIAVTFDDGWCDNAKNALPVARKHGVALTIFIVPGRTGEALPFWPEFAAAAVMTREKDAQQTVESLIESLKGMTAEERNLRLDRIAGAPTTTATSLPVDQTMSWEQIADLRASGVVFGSHTNTHEILTSLSPSQAEREIVDSKHRIEEELHTLCSLFSYPNGDSSSEVRDIVARAGYRMAFLNQEPGVWTFASDRLQIPRVNVCEYHLVDAGGKFSRLIFDYAVVWKAARGLLSETLVEFRKKVSSWWTNVWNTRAWRPSRDDGA